MLAHTFLVCGTSTKRALHAALAHTVGVSDVSLLWTPVFYCVLINCIPLYHPHDVMLVYVYKKFEYKHSQPMSVVLGLQGDHHLHQEECACPHPKQV